ncbi:hypothetical protein [Natronosalvus vescus]|uniref:hypothetical protein n=1 Tax=Natronosalvus vescus TaxID=2953881 RepID=UPI002090C271|nr:hypothetical protein [Natronosalvus vescus]
MSKPDDRPTETPTEDSEDARQEGRWMARNWLAVAVVSIFTMVVLALAMLQATGLIEVPVPFTEAEGGQWAVLAVIAVVVLATGAWSWKALV